MGISQHWTQLQEPVQEVACHGFEEEPDRALGTIFRILGLGLMAWGRTSVDIIKSGGYKISGLEIESVPQELDIVTELRLPRNQMGKLEKKKILERPRQGVQLVGFVAMGAANTKEEFWQVVQMESQQQSLDRSAHHNSALVASAPVPSAAPVAPQPQAAIALKADASPKEVSKEGEAAQAGEPEPPAELTGRRKSLFIGINYYGSQHELHGCVDDVHRIMPLIHGWGFPEDDDHCRVLLDSPDWPRAKRPTKANIMAAISWLVTGAAPGDALFLHYSGHGGREPRTDGRGEWHETLCPVDMEEAGMLMDSELFETLVRPLPSGCRLTCILDACHSAGALDLPYIFTGTPENIKKALAGEAMQMALSKNWLRDFERWSEAEDPTALLGDIASMGLGLWDMYSRYKANAAANQDGFCPDEPGNIGMAVGEVVAITGCASDQTSADVGDVHSEFQLPTGGHLRPGQRSTAGGALTSAFIEAMDPQAMQGSISHLDLLEHLRARLAEAGYSQVPQLASSMVLDLKNSFSLTALATAKQRQCEWQVKLWERWARAQPEPAQPEPAQPAGMFSGLFGGSRGFDEDEFEEQCADDDEDDYEDDEEDYDDYDDDDY
ncbi:unnamed protein product [Effrenium voratum]|nr:unnamed protein product [Effrenium voratum]